MVAQQHVHDLAILVDGTKGGPPTTIDLEQGLVNVPLPSDRMAVPACSLDEARREGMHPVVDRARVDADAPLSQPLRHYRINAINRLRFVVRVPFVPMLRRRSSGTGVVAPSRPGKGFRGMLPPEKERQDGTRGAQLRITGLGHLLRPDSGT